MLKCRLSVCEILNIVKECGYEKAQIKDFNIQNIVASFCYGMKLDLEMLFKAYQTESNFDK